MKKIWYDYVSTKKESWVSCSFKKGNDKVSHKKFTKKISHRVRKYTGTVQYTK